MLDGDQLTESRPTMKESCLAGCFLYLFFSVDTGVGASMPYHHVELLRYIQVSHTYS